ncbi:hypothetical protein PP175_05410 [Aneurinibacillus sp. Ricciae_BoGa-3]|uniref:hypothetical protein n=1 Tax=Aneurinibacillus sp. Ricciae_BoGa-3 TaxID=3022697 RepID=UPI002340D8A7|nr:hypothetical protein [Aneurinibacillus sp. Ricciae_BoGa-3]WCK55390.1 hypothetical protein PP175_05410 [Aneurinibacillus sp. Ricciae_BoGa-3]
MENRPCFETKIGNTSIKIRSALPFMSEEEQARWYRDNDSLPEVQMFKQAWARATWYNHNKKIEKMSKEVQSETPA